MYIPELLSPVGDFECLKAAVQNGANAVYFGAGNFNARARATNFSTDEELKEAIEYAKSRGVKVNLTLNTLIKNNEFEDAVNLAIKAHNFGADALIIQDLGLAHYLHMHYPEITLHASTQMTVHNLEGTKKLLSNGFSRIVLSRELSINEITNIKNNIDGELEIFVHGALCISYSGQCLLSSAIGGRSGNRGLCAQPCRLPYELIDKNESKKIDKGYLLSPRDLCAIEYLPYLIKAGINSFKIEGRLKSPTYVATITRIYRKYIDLVMNNIFLSEEQLVSLIKETLNIKNTDTNLSDLEELTQVFNRGEFSKGHLSTTPNDKLIYKEKPNNMGIYLGEVYHFNSNKGHINIKLAHPVSIGDKISINNESYTISELMIKNQNYQKIDAGNIVTIGRMKGNIKPKQKIYKIENIDLNKKVYPTFKEDKNFKKIKILAEIIIKENTPISLKLFSNEIYYKDIVFEYISEVIPETSLNRPITKEFIIDKFSKTGATEFEFENISVTLDNNLFITVSALNELRRDALIKYKRKVLDSYTHTIPYEANLNTNLKNNIKENNTSNETQISLLLNILNNNFEYTSLENITRIYIPFKYFLLKEYENTLSKITSKFKTYIYMPIILRDNKLDLINNNINNILNKYKISGFVISHISQTILSKYNLELIGNYSLNVYNSYTIQKLKNNNINFITISPELDRDEINDLNNKIDYNSELIVYGRLPVMTNNYCYLGKTNKCHTSCNKDCFKSTNYVLKDRLGFEFPILPDPTFNQTTIFNSKITSITYDDLNVNSLRIDILNETENEIQNIINEVKLGNRFEGKDYTNGKTATRI